MRAEPKQEYFAHVVFAKDLVHWQKTFAAPIHATWVQNKLDATVILIGELFIDESFLTLLRAESMLTMPTYLRDHFEAARHTV